MSEEGRLKTGLEKFIDQAIPGVDYLAQYPGTIVAQNGQLFDFQPDSSKLNGIQGLAFYSGTPGIQITVDTSAQPRAVLFFQGGSPSAPALSFFGNPGLSTLSLTAESSLSLVAPAVNLGSASATLGVARDGDSVQVTFTEADAALILTGATPGAPCSSVAPFTLTGTITSASSVTKSS